MRFPLFNRALLPGMLAGSVVLTGYACSRPDRAESGSNHSSTVVQDSKESDAAGYRPMDRDTGNIPEQVSDSARFTADTSATVDNSGSVEMARDTSTVSDQADTEAGSDGNVTRSDDIADETADEQIVTPDDQEKVAASEAPKDEVGAAAVANGVTGAEAVALMSREGVRCAVIDPETNEAVRWDMASTPVTLNPCGMGSMVLSKVATRGSGAAGQ